MWYVFLYLFTYCIYLSRKTVGFRMIYSDYLLHRIAPYTLYVIRWHVHIQSIVHIYRQVTRKTQFCVCQLQLLLLLFYFFQHSYTISQDILIILSSISIQSKKNRTILLLTKFFGGHILVFSSFCRTGAVITSLYDLNIHKKNREGGEGWRTVTAYHQYSYIYIYVQNQLIYVILHPTADIQSTINCKNNIQLLDFDSY